MMDAAKGAGRVVQFQRIGCMLAGCFTRGPVHNLAGAMRFEPEHF